MRLAGGLGNFFFSNQLILGRLKVQKFARTELRGWPPPSLPPPPLIRVLACTGSVNLPSGIGGVFERSIASEERCSGMSSGLLQPRAGEKSFEVVGGIRRFPPMHRLRTLFSSYDIRMLEWCGTQRCPFCRHRETKRGVNARWHSGVSSKASMSPRSDPPSAATARYPKPAPFGIF
jgi:hypothetical protein